MTHDDDRGATKCIHCKALLPPRGAYPQLCSDCKVLGEKHLVLTMTADVARLAKAWGRLVTPELDPRFVTMLTAASDLDLPMTMRRKVEAYEAFARRVLRTTERGDDFAALVTAWWAHRLRCDDLRMMKMQLAFAKLTEESP